MACNCKNTSHDAGCPFGGIIAGAQTVLAAPKTYEDGLRGAFEAVIELINKNYAGSEAKSFRHALKREIRRVAAEKGVVLK